MAAGASFNDASAASNKSDLFFVDDVDGRVDEADGRVDGVVALRPRSLPLACCFLSVEKMQA